MRPTCGDTHPPPRSCRPGGSAGERCAGGVVAVVAAHDAEVAPGVREHPLLDVLHPRAVHPERDLVLLLAGHRAGVTADALALVDDEAVSHVSGSPRRARRAA